MRDVAFQHAAIVHCNDGAAFELADAGVLFCASRVTRIARSRIVFNMMPTKPYRMNAVVMAMPNNAESRSLLARAVVIAGLGLLLAGCSTREPGESIGGRLLVAPGKFTNYSCQQLEIRANGVAARRKQLDQLMAKAGTTPDGRFVSLMAYQAEYTETGADLAELRRAAAAKDCKPFASLQTPPSAR